MSYLKRIAQIVFPSQLRQLRQNIREQLAAELNLTPRTSIHEKDVVVVGFPKSGNTWFQNLIAGVVYNIDVRNLPITLIHEVVPPLGRPYYRRYHTPTYFKSHALPKPEYRRVIYLVRDGRDAMVSYYHYRRGVGEPVTWEYLLSQGAQSLGQWYTHVQRWIENPHQADFVTIRYEDLLANPIRQMRTLCAFAGIERDDDVLQWAVDNAAFDKMQQREAVYGAGQNFSKDEKFVRRGQRGSYKDEMPPHILKQFETQAREALIACGYSFDE